MRKIWLPLIAVCLFLPASAQALCVGDNPWNNVPTYHVCGTVRQIGFDGTYFRDEPTGKAYVKICRAGSTTNCTTTSTTQHTENGTTTQAFKFPDYRRGSTSYLEYDLYAWGYTSTSYWGTSTTPIYRTWIGPNGLHGIYLRMPPRPQDPTPIYPSGTNVPSSYTVTWKSGVDIDRKPYPITYEVWYKYWPFGEPEPATWLLSRADMPCQDDGSGPNFFNECSTYVAGPQPPGNWKWAVVANLNVSVHYSNMILTTESSELYFQQPY